MLLFLLLFVSQGSSEEKFSTNFTFGVASSAYQVEGSWNLDGRGESIWDYALHNNPERVDDGTNGDIASDSYRQWQKDIEILKFLGVDFYRFSLSWSRILPNGKINHINQAGIDYYNKLINGLLAEGIQPQVTLYHWDLPQALEENGGFLNQSVINDFVNYAKLAFQNFGDRVKVWFTFNEPYHTCEFGYNIGIDAPFVKNYGFGGYRCGHNLLLAHAKAYRMYQKEFKNIQNGQIGLVGDSFWFEPKPGSETGEEASTRTIEMQLGWFFNPLVYGNYPEVMIERVRELSLKENLNKSRLPEFSKNEQKLLKGSFDFLGINYYSTRYVEFGTNITTVGSVYSKELGVVKSPDPSWPGSGASWLLVVPEGLRKLLVWVKNRYENPKQLITENGYADDGRLNDSGRISFLKRHLVEVWKAINEDGCQIIGYTHWGIVDYFEWTFGFKFGFGLFKVDYNDTEKRRIPKESSRVYKKIIADRGLK